MKELAIAHSSFLKVLEGLGLGINEKLSLKHWGSGESGTVLTRKQISPNTLLTPD